MATENDHKGSEKKSKLKIPDFKIVGSLKDENLVACDCYYDKETGRYYAVPNPDGGWAMPVSAE